LVQAGLLSSERQGRMIIYRVDFAAMDQLLKYLLENCCQGEACLTDILGSLSECSADSRDNA
jgi:hypothetical protein